MVMISLTISAILSIIFGIIILAWPKSLNYVVAIWLLVSGMLQILTSMNI